MEIVSATPEVVSAVGGVAAQHRLRLFAPPVPVAGFDVAMAWPTQHHGDPAVEWLKEQIRALLA